MTNIEELIVTRRIEVVEKIAELKNELDKIDHILSQVNSDIRAPVPTPTLQEKITPREELIIEAVKHGNTRPRAIDQFIRKNYKTRMNIGSLRSTLSRMKSEGKIRHDENGWIM